jgi:hypothetical protein
MVFRLAADLTVLLHFGFILFVMLGGLLVLRWHRLAWVHLPAAGWGALIEMQGWICPLTPLEKRLRDAGGAAGYPGGFVEHYLIPIIYPSGLTREIQFFICTGVILVNVLFYGILILRRSRGASSG